MGRSSLQKLVASVLLRADRHVLYHFRKNGLKNLTLILLILEPGATTEMSRDIEQYCIDTFCPNLNEEEIVTRLGMTSKCFRYLLAKNTQFIMGRRSLERNGVGVEKYPKVFFHSAWVGLDVPGLRGRGTLCLVFKSDSIQYLGNIFKISRVTIRNCAKLGSLFLNRFLFSLEPIA
jgi:hypothetical protein